MIGKRHGRHRYVMDAVARIKVPVPTYSRVYRYKLGKERTEPANSGTEWTFYFTRKLNNFRKTFYGIKPNMNLSRLEVNT